MPYSYRVISIAGAVALAIGLAAPTFGADNTLTPSLKVEGQYDDNITFSQTEEISDYAVITSPGLELDSLTERFRLEALGVVDIFSYIEEDDLDTVNQFYRLEADYDLTQRLNVFGGGRYRKDTTLDSFLDEIGRVAERQNRERWDGGGGLSYRLTERFSIGAEYLYQRVNYEREESVDYDKQTVLVPMSIYFEGGVYTLTIQPLYSRWNYRDTDDINNAEFIDNYELSANLRYRYSETFTWNIALGGRYTEAEFNDQTTDDNTGWIGDINFEKEWERTLLLFGFKRDIQSQTDGDLVQVDRFYAGFRYRITERAGFSFQGGLWFSETGENIEFESLPDDQRTYRLKPRLFYDITPTLSINLEYTHTNNYNSNRETDRTRMRNRYGIYLDYELPIKF